MANLTREQILGRKTGKGTATLPDGTTVGIRALTRDEVLKTQEVEDLGAKDSLMISLGMTDPKLTPEDVAAWAGAGAAGDLVAISEAIATISGLVQGAGKSGVAGV